MKKTASEKQHPLPGATPNEQAYVFAMRGKIAHRAKHYAAMADAYARAINLDSQNAAYHYGLGLAQQKMGRLEEALNSLGKAIELDGGNPLYYDSRGLTNAALGQENAALIDIGKAIALKSDYAVYYDHRSSVCLSMGRLPEALADEEKAIALAPDFDAFYDSRGYIYYEMGDYPNAYFDFCRAAELDPSNAEYQADAGAALFQLGRYEEAVMKLSTSVARNEHLDYAYSYRGLARLKLALSEKRPPDTPDILQDVSYAIELQPSYKNYLRRGQYYLLAGDAENALHDLMKAESQTMDFPSADIAHWLSLAHGFLHNDSLAQNYQKKAARLGFREKPEP